MSNTNKIQQIQKMVSAAAVNQNNFKVREQAINPNATATVVSTTGADAGQVVRPSWMK